MTNKAQNHQDNNTNSQNTQELTEQSIEELHGISVRTFLYQLTASSILKINEKLKQQDRALDEELLKDKQALKEVEYYAKVLGNPNIIDNILMGGLEGSAALKHELVELKALHQAGWDIYNPSEIEIIRLRFKQSFEDHEPQQYIPFHLEALKAELEYVQQKLHTKNIVADLGIIAKALYRLDVDEQELTEKLDKTVTELEALNINYPFNKLIPEELRNAL